MKTLITAALLGMIAGGGVAVAETLAPTIVKPMRGDTNGDGEVSRAEFVKQAEARFAQLDTNKDGFVTRTEVRAALGASGGSARSAIAQDGAAPPPPGDAMRGPRGSGGGMARLDTDGDGRVTRAEYDAQVAKRFARMDTNGDGIVDKTEMAALPGGGRMAGRFDADGSGTLTRAEFDARSAERFARMDMNGDGVVDAAELQAAPTGRGGNGGARQPRPMATPTPPAPSGA